MSHAAQQGPPPRDAYGAKWGAHIESPTRRRIRSEVYADEYPADVDPRSFLTWTELRRLARDLHVGPGDTFVDLGCGQGGPGLWVARETGADVVGIDLAEAAIARARERTQQLGLAGRAHFAVERYDLQPDAEVKRRAYCERLVAAEAALVRELGEEATGRLLFEAKATLGLVDGVDYLAHSRRIFVVARKRDPAVTG
jgi:SAM-dependent methyltransferase